MSLGTQESGVPTFHRCRLRETVYVIGRIELKRDAVHMEIYSLTQ